MNLEILKKKIAFDLAVLSRYIEGLNSIHYFDINTSSEDFFKGLLNRIYGYELENINITDMNACAIDLGDKNNKIAIQVTSDKKSDKIKYTLEKFLEKELYKEYSKLIILVITEKQSSYSITFETNGKFNFGKDNIIDYKDIIKEINGKDTQKLQEIFEFIEQEFSIPHNAKNRNTSNEIDTIINLISFISDNKLEIPLNIGEQYEPDPEYKIEKRFNEYAAFLKNTYKTLYTIYGEMIEDIEKRLEMDVIKITLISTFLKDISVKCLIQNENNPIIALESLVEYFESEMQKANLNYDKMAIKGYLINQVIKCNIFPNEV